MKRMLLGVIVENQKRKMILLSLNLPGVKGRLEKCGVTLVLCYGGKRVERGEWR
jgi:hypothetical protein